MRPVCVDNGGRVLSELIRFCQTCCVLKATLFDFSLSRCEIALTLDGPLRLHSLLHALRSLMPPPVLLLLLFLLPCPEVWSYEAPEDKQDVFARRACPAFLTFTNAAYLAGVTLELPCCCKPEQVTPPTIL